MVIKKKYIFVFIVLFVSLIIYVFKLIKVDYISGKSDFSEVVESSGKEFVFSGKNKFKPYLLNISIWELDVKDEIIDEFLRSGAIERLKWIEQAGPIVYFGMAPYFSRYEHSLGVMYLIKKYGGTLNEQIAGLLHDSSHTVFSHLSDILFKIGWSSESSYQDNIQKWYLKESGLEDIANRYFISIDDISADNEFYQMLEQPLPDMCADRIEYNIHTGYIYNLISKSDVNSIIEHLKYDHDKKKWYFDSVEWAKKFANLSLYFTKEVWGSAWNIVFYEVFAIALRRALSLGSITLNEIHFGTDFAVIKKMKGLNDKKINKVFECCKNIGAIFELTEKDNYDLERYPKFRGIDPFVKIKNELIRLTKLDKEFCENYYSTKAFCEKGHRIKLLFDINSI
jgi:HD superfamily phosphohydrolase